MWLVECDKIGNVDQNLAKSKELEEYILKTLKIIVVLQVSVKKSIYQNLVKNRKKIYCSAARRFTPFTLCGPPEAAIGTCL